MAPSVAAPPSPNSVESASPLPGFSLFGGKVIITRWAFLLWLFLGAYSCYATVRMAEGSWQLALLFLLLVTLQLVLHEGSHALAATLLGGKVEAVVFRSFMVGVEISYCDRLRYRRSLIALAGPSTDLLVASFAYLLWRQEGLVFLYFLALWSGLSFLVNLLVPLPGTDGHQALSGLREDLRRA